MKISSLYFSGNALQITLIKSIDGKDLKMNKNEQMISLLYDAKIILERLEETAFTWECRYNNQASRLEELKSLDSFFSTKDTRQAVQKAERRKNKYRSICFRLYSKIDVYREMVDAIQKAYDIG